MGLILEQFDSIISSAFGVTKEVLTENDLKAAVSDKVKLYQYIEKIGKELPSELHEIFESAAQEFTSALLQETEVIKNGQALAAVIAYYPAIAELYQQPVLYKLAIPFKTDNGKLQVNILRRIAKLMEGDNVIATVEVPRPVNLYQNLYKELTFTANTSDNIFSKAGLNGTGYKVLLTRTTAVQLVWNDGKNDHTVNFIAYVRSDKTIQKRINLGSTVGYIDLFIKIDDRSGDITVSATPKPASKDVTITPKTVTIKTLITNTDAKSGYKIVFDEQIDTVDRYVESDIPYEAITDVWKTVEFQGQYNIDYLRTLSAAIKAQIQLMKDNDIATELQNNENGFSANLTVDFNNIPPSMNPANPMDFYSFMIPALIKAKNMVYNETSLEPTYIAVNPQDAHIIEGLTNYVTMMGNPISKMGVSASDVLGIQKFTVIKSGYIPQGKLYLLTQGNRNNPGIVDAILGTPIVKTTQEGTKTRVMVFPNSAVVFIDPKKMALVNITNAPIF